MSKSTPSLISDPNASAKTPSNWKTKLASCCNGFLIASKPILNAAIKFGADAAASALKTQIEQDGNLTPQQKAALGNITAAALSALSTEVTVKVNKHITEHQTDANPLLNQAVDITIQMGVADAFMPGLHLTGGAVGTRGIAPPLLPTDPMLPTSPKAAGGYARQWSTTLAESSASGVAGASDSAHHSAALARFKAAGHAVAKHKALVAAHASYNLAEIVEQAIEHAEGLSNKEKKALLHSGAALAFMRSVIDAQKTTETLQILQSHSANYHDEAGGALALDDSIHLGGEQLHHDA